MSYFILPFLSLWELDNRRRSSQLIQVFFSLLASFSLESVWQQVTSGLPDSSEYSSRSQRYWGLNGLDSPSDFQLFQSPFQIFWDHSTTTGITVTCMFHSFFLFSGKVPVFIFYLFFYIYTVVRWKSKIHSTDSLLFVNYNSFSRGKNINKNRGNISLVFVCRKVRVRFDIFSGNKTNLLKQ